MDELIKALQILRKYGNPDYPTNCEHGVLYVSINPEVVSDEDIIELGILCFQPDRTLKKFKSYKFGSY